MSRPTVMITGGLGCIGAEVTKWFLSHTDATVLVCSRSVSQARLKRVFDGYEADRIETMSVDIADSKQVDTIFRKHPISHVIHLAALQTPDCNADRDLGLQVNLAGTQHLVEVMKRFGSQIKRFVFASSIAVYGPRSLYPSGAVPCGVDPLPSGPYGVWKLAGEHLARLFHEDTGVPTVCLRPAVLYGPGRDIGLTSSPTTAMKHVVQGLPYEIPFCSRQDYQFAPDVGAATAISASDSFDGYGVFTMPSHTKTTEEILQVISTVASELNGMPEPEITIGDQEVPFICDLECNDFLARFPQTPHTSMEEGVRATLQEFAKQNEKGWLVLG